jgi:hypothetical protein
VDDVHVENKIFQQIRHHKTSRKNPKTRRNVDVVMAVVPVYERTIVVHSLITCPNVDVVKSDPWWAII